MRALSTEFKKIRRRKVWLIVAAMIFVQLMWALWAFRSVANRDLAQGWFYCLYQFPLLNSIMMPVVAAVVASRLSDVEHKGNTFKLLETVIPAGRLFDSKFLCGAAYLVLASLMQVIMIIVLGKLRNFSGNTPYGLLGLYLLFTSAVNLTILLLQQVLSLLFANQMAALSVGLLGGLCGLFIMFLPAWLEKLVLWGYYGVLMLVGMDWDIASRISSFYLVSADWKGFILLCLMFCAIYIIGRALFVRKEM